ncbi:MAG: PGF-pre-PGF domain-containing protein [Methanosarcinaceae archaeon]|nr:PGF-pre-PGF domain-containing protein [Methanosarcinaceae archaeon]
MVHIAFIVACKFHDPAINRCYGFGLSFLCLVLIPLVLICSSVAAGAISYNEANTFEMDGAPVLELIGDRYVNENSLLSFEISARGSDNDTISYYSPDLPEGASLNGTSGVFEWIPDYDQSGLHHVEFIADDGEYSDSEHVAITVLNVNRPPVFSIIADSETDENSPLVITLEASDPDGDILEFSRDVSFGTISGNKFSWVPSYDDSGNHTINFAVSDGSTEVVRTAKVSVRDVNRPPVLYSISDVTVMENEVVDIELFGFDPDNDHLIFSNVSALPDGAVFDNVTGTFHWIPSDMDIGQNDIDFVVSDGVAFSSEKRAEIMVGTSNSPPVFDPITSQSTDENSTLSFVVSATDKDMQDSLIYSMGTFPEGATFESTSGSFDWTPSFEQAGTHIVEFMVLDSSIFTFKSFATILIDVNDINRAPEIAPVNNYIIDEKEPLIINISVSDADGDPLSISTNKSFGTFRGNTFIWTPGYFDSGIYDVQFTVSDGDLSADTTTTIYVEEANMPPEINSIGSRTVNVNNALSFTVSADDDEYDNLSLSAGGLPSGAMFDSSNGHFTWTPAPGQEGLHTVSFRVTDAGGLRDYETISITVKKASQTVDETNPTTSTGSGGGGGGGGGGSQTTGEDYENIEFKDYAIRTVLRDVETVFSFGKEGNSIISVSFTADLNGGQTKAVIEMLKDTSSLVSKPPPGEIYKNVNIWMGDGKFLPKLVSSAKVAFRVEKSWMDDKGIDPDSIKLLRYSGNEWEQLPTSRTDSSDECFCYIADTPGFSPFAISSVKAEVANEEGSGERTEPLSRVQFIKNSVVDMTASGSNAATGTEEPTVSYLFMFVLLGVFSIGVIGYNKREYCEQYYQKVRVKFGNYDGKRYRRGRL